MGARREIMLASYPHQTDRILFAPGGLETFETHRDQCLGGVLPVARLRPCDDERPGRQRERFIEAEPSTFVARPHAEVGVEEDAAAFLGTRAVRPMLRIRWHEVAAVFPEVKARFRLDEVFDVDHPEMLTVVQELVVFVVAMRWDRSLG